MASRKPTRRRTYLSLERLDDRVTPAIVLPATPGTSLSALTGAAFSTPSSGIFPGLGNVVSIPSLTANTGATTGFTGIGTTGAGTVFGGQPSATAFFTGTPVSTAAGSTALGNLSTILGATQASTTVGFNPNSNTFVIPGLGATASTFTSPVNPTVVDPVQVAASTPATVQTLNPAFTTALLNPGSFFGNGLTTLGNGFNLATPGLLNLTTTGLNASPVTTGLAGLNALPATSLAGATTNLTSTVPSFTSGTFLPVTATVPSVPISSTAFGVSTLPTGFFQTSLSPMIQGTSIARAATQPLGSTGLFSVPSAALNATPVAAPFAFQTTTSPMTTGNNALMTASPFGITFVPA